MNPYHVLEISPDADEATIKQAYRRLAMKYHPDRNSDSKAVEQFKQINAAYALLSDPTKKHQYDTQGQQRTSFNGFGSFEDIFSAFSDMFEHRTSQTYVQRGADISQKISISLETSIKGGHFRLNKKIPTSCHHCDGTGAQDKKMTSCSICQGMGYTTHSVMNIGVRRQCVSCHGVGQIPLTPCRFCDGTGQEIQNKSWDITLPAGIDDGDVLRLKNEGMPGHPAGDLLIHVSIEKHSFYKRDGGHLFINVPLRFTQASLGGSIEIPHLNGERITVKIPKGTQHGDTVVLKNKGVQPLRGNKGHIHVRFEIETPIQLTKEQKDLLSRFDTLQKEKNNPKSQTFWEKIKQFFE